METAALPEGSPQRLTAFGGFHRTFGGLRVREKNTDLVFLTAGSHRKVAVSQWPKLVLLVKILYGLSQIGNTDACFTWIMEVACNISQSDNVYLTK